MFGCFGLCLNAFLFGRFCQHLYAWMFFLLCLHLFMFLLSHVCMFGCFPIFSLVSRLCAPPVERRGSGYLCWATTTPPQPARYENCPLSFASSLQPTRILPPGILGLSTFVFRSETNCLFVSNQEQWALHVTSLAKCSSTAPLCSCGPD